MDGAQIKHANIKYHDAAADEYDAKWGIGFGELGQAQVIQKLKKALPGHSAQFRRALEIGSGTGYFSLNLLLAGAIDEVVCTDISPGMLNALKGSARELGLESRVVTRVTEAEDMPYEDGSFDLIFGHAVLHHLPNLAASFAEFERLLEPGGSLMFGGEPSRYGDKIASIPKRAAWTVAPLWRRLVSARPAINDHAEDDGHIFESQVDVHAFTPHDLAGFAREAGFADVNVIGEELAANWFGWANRTLEASARPEDLPRLWLNYAHRGWLTLQRIDQKLLEGRLPAAIFYNLLLAARKPL